MKVRKKSVSYAAIKSSRIRSREDILYKEIEDLDKKIDEKIFCTVEQMSQLQTKLDDYRNEIERIIEYRTKGAILRSKTRWYNEGEKNTKYFLNLEKRQYKQGTISRLKRNENDYVTTDKETLHECKTFYKDLYASKLDPEDLLSLTDFFFSDNDTVLSSDQSEAIEGNLTKVECLKALKEMNSGKSPGTDGLPAEFYQTFWKEISEPLLVALNHAFAIGQLSITQRRGIIKLIPKKSEELYYIRN